MDALKQINETIAISVIVDHGRVQDSSTKSEMETLFNFYLPFKMPLSSVLDYLTKQQNLEWIVRNDYILITSKKDAEKKNNVNYTRTYYIGDLLEKPPLLLNEKEPQVVPISDDDFRLIIDYITVIIESETLDGNILPYYPNKSLVIRQSIKVHEQITELLKMLRQYNRFDN